MTLAYLDSSAFVKTIVVEPESERLRTWLADWPDRASAALLRTEAVRAVRDQGAEWIERAREELENVRLVELDSALLGSAADLQVDVRSLDAIHLAAALALGSDLGPVVSYDARMIAAAGELGLEVASPS